MGVYAGEEKPRKSHKEQDNTQAHLAFLTVCLMINTQTCNFLIRCYIKYFICAFGKCVTSGSIHVQEILLH